MKNLILYLMFFVLMACSNKKHKENEANKDTAVSQSGTLTSIGNSEKLDTNDVSFFREAAYGGMTEVQSSEKILTVTENPTIKAFAEMMVKDHGVANEQLKLLAQSKGYVLPATLPNSKVMLINKMDAFKDEGRNEYYLKLMINEHINAIDLFSLASRSTDKEINQFASSLLPTLKHHYQHILKADSLFKVPRANQGDDPLKISNRKKQ